METAKGPSRGLRVPWDRVRAWIDTQEALERQHGRPAPLSQAELEAISVLVSFGDEPDVGDRDHVSALMQTIQARGIMPPIFVDDESINMPVDGRLKLMWRCVCSVEDYGSFPREKYGVETGEQPPSFQSKKNAKRYAAKHALQYMRDFPHKANKRAAAMMSPSPARVSPAHKMKSEDSPPRPSQASEGPAHDSRPSSGGPDGDDTACVLKQISALAGRLGFDNPSYHIEPDVEMPSFFSGRPVFKHGALIPPDLGVVSGVLGKREARMQVAERVLEWLQAEQQRRDKIVESLLENCP